LFTSDHGRVYNLRRYDLATGAMTTLTNVPGGAFYPSESANGLYYIGYGSRGFDLYRLAEVKETPTPKAAPGPSVVVEPEPAPVPNTRITGYAPDTGVRPRWWLPYIAIDSQRTELGVSTSGADPLYRHMYAVTAAYDFKNSSPIGAFDYVYDGWYPILKLHASRFDNLTYDDDDEFVRLRHDDRYRAEVMFPWHRYRRQFAFHVAGVRDREADVRRANGVAAQPDVHDSLLGGAITFDSTRAYPLSVSRSHGREIRLLAEDSDRFGGDYRGRVYTADWREFFALGREHVLALRLVEGRGSDGSRPFKLGGSDTDYELPSAFAGALGTPFNRRDYALRGYREGRADLTDQNMRLASLEYRFPIWRVERGAMVPFPIALRHLSGTAFVDSGTVWSRDGKPDDYRTGAGVELMTSISLFYGGYADLRLGYAHGFDEGGVDQVYLRVGAAF
jgi:hypothetical protein